MLFTNYLNKNDHTTEKKMIDNQQITNTLLNAGLEPSGLAWEVNAKSLELDNKETLHEVLFNACISETDVIIVLNTFVDYRFVHVSLAHHFTTKYLRFNLSSTDSFASILTSKAPHILAEINELETRESVIPK